MQATDILNNLGAIGGILTIVGGGFWFVANWKAKRTVETSKAEQTEAETDKLHDEIRKANYEWQHEQALKFEEFKKESNRKIHGMQRVLTYMLGDKRQEEFFHCSDVKCTLRDPALGKYKRSLPDWVSEIISDESGTEGKDI